jgi:hypothetical protein
MSETVALKNAEAHRDRLVAELKQVEQFIADYRQYSASGQPRPPRGFIKGQKDEIRRHIVAVLTEAQAPLRNRDIVECLKERGVEIKAASAANYVGIIVHRNLDIFERGPNGYSLKKTALKIVEAA